MRQLFILVAGFFTFLNLAVADLNQLGGGLFKKRAPLNAAVPWFTANNLNQLELKTFSSPEQVLHDEKQEEMFESNPLLQKGLFEESMEDLSFFETQELGNEIEISIYQQTSEIKWNFLVLKENGHIRYVFAASPGRPGHRTPVSDQDGGWDVVSQAWRHTSTKYPYPRGNMDHVTYFRPMYGIHATGLGMYHKLGKTDSHGCVRLARPEARAVYKMVAQNRSTVRIHSYRGKSISAEESALVKKLLAADLNFIQHELLAKNESGDVPFSTSSEYFYFKSLEESRNAQELERLKKKYKIKNLHEVAPYQGSTGAPL